MESALLKIGLKWFNLELPSNWDELTPEQFEAVNFLRCTAADKRIMVFEILMVLLPLQRQHLKALIQLMWQKRQWSTCIKLAWLFCFFKSRYMWQWFATDDVIDALPSIDWIFDPKKNRRTSALPTLKHNGVQYSGPRTLLSGIIWKQMQMADALVDRFAAEKNEELLNHLAAVLYVPNLRKFNTEDDSIPERVEAFRTLAIHTKYAIYTNYVMLRDAFYQQFELPKAELAVEGRPDWEAVTLQVAENGSLGTYQEVEYAPARTVMKYFEVAHKRERKLKKK